ncbi:hypothetical protein AVEN_90292-1 [Araneus ventricosus]|uniref:Uncharacterized protein n=1 Tax=Araneus ventricosus TaxID=182803 RepID=A0A4Y2UQR2_ARAVE|nr:hypothetical protein AVEN_90292-1 [Araneus ventricosus]
MLQEQQCLSRARPKVDVYYGKMIDVEDASADEEENDTVPPLQAKAPSIEVDSTAEKKLPDTPPASEEDVSVTTPEPIVPEPTAPTETVPLQKDATPPESQSLAKGKIY